MEIVYMYLWVFTFTFLLEFYQSYVEYKNDKPYYLTEFKFSFGRSFFRSLWAGLNWGIIFVGIKLVSDFIVNLVEACFA